MTEKIFPLRDPLKYRKAGATDLIELYPAPHAAPLFLHKWVLEVLTYSIVHHKFIHLSGPTGSAKSSLVEAMYLEPRNFRAVCDCAGFPYRPIKLFAVEMAIFESPGEIYQRRALRDGQTYDEPSMLISYLEEACQIVDDFYPVIHLREIGRVHSAGVQGGLLDLITPSHVELPGGKQLQTEGVCWLADSNYQAEEDARHTLVPMDDALARRFSVNLTLGYLSAEEEREIVRALCNGEVTEQHLKIVKLGHAVRKERAHGSLQSVSPPTIASYLTFIHMAQLLPSLSLKQVAQSTLVGNASNEDQKHVESILNNVFGLVANGAENAEIGENLF